MKKRNLIITLVIAVIVILVGAAIIYGVKHKGQKQNNGSGSSGSSNNISVNLTADQLKLFEDKIKAQQAIIDDPKSTQADKESAYLVMGINYETLGQRDQEEQSYIQASNVDPNSYIPWVDLGNLYVEENKFQQASSAFQKAISLDPTVVLSWEKWIDFNRYQLKTDWHLVDNIFSQAFPATKDDLNLHKYYANFLEDQGQVSSAITQWQYILSKDPSEKTIINAEIARLKAIK